MSVITLPAILSTVVRANELEDLSSSDSIEDVNKVSLSEEERIKRKLEAQAKLTGKDSSGRESYQVLLSDITTHVNFNFAKIYVAHS